ncbi:MAG: mechanosensitive ion channel domain-containing protein [bacterium]
MSNIDAISSIALQAQEQAPWLTFNKLIEWLNKPIATLGRTEVTISGLATAFIVFLPFLTVSAVIQRLLAPWLNRRLQKSPGVAYAIRRITHYLIILVGLAVSAQVIGLDMSSFAIVIGFLSVGIGFGLQNITSNFISGLILLLERPISVGDLVSVEGQVGMVQEIRMRSTVIQTFDNISIIVPNSRFIDSVLINWSLGDPKVRIHIAVGVAYGSDLKKVTEVLMRVAGAEPTRAQAPRAGGFLSGVRRLVAEFRIAGLAHGPAQTKSGEERTQFRRGRGVSRGGHHHPLPAARCAHPIHRRDQPFKARLIFSGRFLNHKDTKAQRLIFSLRALVSLW